MKSLRSCLIALIFLIIFCHLQVAAINTNRVSLKVVGDIMVHDVQYYSAYNYQTGEYDFNPMFEHIKKHLKADLLVGNLETTFAGQDAIYSSFPRFNTPDSLAVTLKDCGFDLLFTANNHSMDKGVHGLKRTIDILNQHQILQTGTFKNPEDRLEAKVLSAGGISFGFLNYTYGTNGLLPPVGQEYIINYLNIDKIEEDILRIKNEVDLVVVGLHFGEEYQREPNSQQKALAQEVAILGADIILGSHAHVLQPYEFINVDGREVFVVYSLGNFVSGQKGRYRDSGAILELVFERNPLPMKPKIVKVDYTPVWVRRFYEAQRLKIDIVPYSEGTIEQLKLNEQELMILNQVKNDVSGTWSTTRRISFPMDFIRIAGRVAVVPFSSKVLPLSLFVH